MTAVVEICKRCGEKFLRGIYPQSICEQCSIKQKPKVYISKD